MNRKTTRYRIPPFLEAVRAAKSFQEARELYDQALQQLRRASVQTRCQWTSALLRRAETEGQAVEVHLEALKRIPAAGPRWVAEWRQLVEAARQREAVARRPALVLP